MFGFAFFGGAQLNRYLWFYRYMHFVFIVLYVGCRLYLLFESIYSLFYLPLGAYITTCKYPAPDLPFHLRTFLRRSNFSLLEIPSFCWCRWPAQGHRTFHILVIASGYSLLRRDTTLPLSSLHPLDSWKRLFRWPCFLFVASRCSHAFMTLRYDLISWCQKNIQVLSSFSYSEGKGLNIGTIFRLVLSCCDRRALSRCGHHLVECTYHMFFVSLISPTLFDTLSLSVYLFVGPRWVRLGSAFPSRESRFQLSSRLKLGFYTIYIPLWQSSYELLRNVSFWN